MCFNVDIYVNSYKIFQCFVSVDEEITILLHFRYYLYDQFMSTCIYNQYIYISIHVHIHSTSFRTLFPLQICFLHFGIDYVQAFKIGVCCKWYPDSINVRSLNLRKTLIVFCRSHVNVISQLQTRDSSSIKFKYYLT